MLIVHLDQIAKNIEKSREENKTNHVKIYIHKIVCEVSSLYLNGQNLRFSIRSAFCQYDKINQYQGPGNYGKDIKIVGFWFGIT
jgi:hypothetical protein